MSKVYDNEDNDSCSTCTNVLLDYKWWESKSFNTKLDEKRSEKSRQSIAQVSTKSNEQEENKILTTNRSIEQKKLYYDVEENSPFKKVIDFDSLLTKTNQDVFITETTPIVTNKRKERKTAENVKITGVKLYDEVEENLS